MVIGEKIKLRLFKARDGVKEFTGVLEAFDGSIALKVDGNTLTFAQNEIAKANLCDFE